MIKKLLTLNILLLAGVSFFAWTGNANAQIMIDEHFNPANIISDEEILDFRTMNRDSIQKFLEGKKSFLATYKAPNPDGQMMLASDIIYDRAITNQVNPKFIIVLLQKEQGLIEDDSPKQSRLDWACGYGCPDGGGCNERWRGLWKQINSASLQFRDYMDNPHLYSFKSGYDYNFTNPYGTISNEPMLVTPKNQATAALYNYTPHVFNGNYNFYRIWKRYFQRAYPSGTVLSVKGVDGIYLIQNGVKRLFANKGAFTSRYDSKKIIYTTQADLDSYETGSPIKYPQYSLLKNPKGTIYLLIDNKKRAFFNYSVFRRIGFNPEEIINATPADLAAYDDGPMITATSTFALGALLQDKKTGGVFYVEEETKAPIQDRIFLKTKFKGRKIKAVPSAQLAKYKTIDPVKFDDGELVKPVAGIGVFLVSNGELRPFPSGEVFEKLGYKWENIITLPDKLLKKYPEGELMGLVMPQADTSILPTLTSTRTTTATSTIADIATATTSTSTVSLATTTPLN